MVTVVVPVTLVNQIDMITVVGPVALANLVDLVTVVAPVVLVSLIDVVTMVGHDSIGSSVVWCFNYGMVFIGSPTSNGYHLKLLSFEFLSFF